MGRDVPLTWGRFWNFTHTRDSTSGWTRGERGTDDFTGEVEGEGGPREPTAERAQLTPQLGHSLMLRPLEEHVTMPLFSAFRQIVRLLELQTPHAADQPETST